MKRTLGRSGIQVSAMGLGCAAIGGPFKDEYGRTLGYGDVDKKESIRAIRRSLDLGVTLFDTSNIYGCGHSETVLGEALKGRREEVIIATKFGLAWKETSHSSSVPCQVIEQKITPKFIQKSCEDSLKRLQTDYIDLYQLHLNRMDPKRTPEVLTTLEDLAEEGKIHYYGWSTDDPNRARIFAKGKHCTIVQFKHNLTFHNFRMIEEIINGFNLAGLIKGPLGSGILTGKYKDDSKLPNNHLLHSIIFDQGRIAKVRTLLEEIHEILIDDGRTLAQAALGWIWAQNDMLIPIPGFRNMIQVEENVKAMEFGPLSRKKVSQINKVLSKIDTNLEKGYFV
ncbi:MAG: aldo/keto reductase [Candidatus Heimdallarchaeota archaeon]|nr:MAG: aldo/keto reductase [Candidatus Heimdallarchaeota archaeon]